MGIRLYSIKEKGEVSYTINYEDYNSAFSFHPIEVAPVTVSLPFAFDHGIPQSVFVGETATDKITIKNTSEETLELWCVDIYASNPENSFTLLSYMEPPTANATIEELEDFFRSFSLNNLIIQPDETLTVWLSCKPKKIGLHTTIVHFDVGIHEIERVSFLLADDKISQSLVSRNPYSRGRKRRHNMVDSYIPDSRPARTQGRGLIDFLPLYDFRSKIRDEVGREETLSAVREGLKSDNYILYFTTLLNMEEIQVEEDMRAYDMKNVFMNRNGYQWLYLKVPGLAHRRPSLVSGDYICVKMPIGHGNGSVSAYQGYIHHVVGDEVYPIFAPQFLSNHGNDDLFDVQFTYNRINMRRFYQAIDATKSLAKEFLFPYEFSYRRYIKTNPLVPITQNINEVQMRCVQMILGCRGAPPYLVHGPPGIGKTQTLVEAILQLYTTRKNARILVCAPSNGAADYILERLLSEESVEICDTDVFRLDASSQLYEDVKSNLHQLCFFDEQILKCPHNALVHSKIVVSTYTSASLLYEENIRRGHFSHIFLDGAGKVLEPEAIIPLSNLCLRNTVVVLAGDLAQLDPVVCSKEAKNYGLGKSYLKRLFECKYYCTGDENYIFKLFRNDIVHLPSTLPSNECSVRFYGIQGCNEREDNNPSLFNRIEVSKVTKIINKLIVGENLIEGNIGAITPYRQQVLKIRKALDSMDMVNVKVGSVEQFRRQEKRVIIVSTVRSSVKHSEPNELDGLGVLSNPRWYNGAITRATSLLVIVGNPHILFQDAYWSKVLWECVDNNSYKGCSLPGRVFPSWKGYPTRTYEECSMQF